jgi:tetratricopeptide (TPR) repeat protein
LADRRAALLKLLASSAGAYAVPLVASFSMGGAGGAREALMAGVAAARRRRPGPEQDGLVFLELADLERAEGRDAHPVVEELLELFPSNAQGLALRAQLNLDGGRIEAAEADFRALAAWPTSHAASTTALGYWPALFDALAFEGIAACHWRRARYVAAAEWFARAHEAAPDHAELKYKHALCRKLSAASPPAPPG